MARRLGGRRPDAPVAARRCYSEDARRSVHSRANFTRQLLSSATYRWPDSEVWPYSASESQPAPAPRLTVSTFTNFDGYLSQSSVELTAILYERSTLSRCQYFGHCDSRLAADLMIFLWLRAVQRTTKIAWKEFH